MCIKITAIPKKVALAKTSAHTQNRSDRDLMAKMTADPSHGILRRVRHQHADGKALGIEASPILLAQADIVIA
jgi:hypothetical protein